MPGIAGIIHRVGDGICPEGIAQMLDRMVHDPAWTIGKESVPRLGFSGGSVARPGSYAAQAPVWNPDRTIGLIFTGEEFTLEARIGELQRLRQAPESHRKGAAALLPWYEEMGPRFLRELNGWFSGVIIDLRLGQIILFNDRYGLGRVYLHEDSAGTFSFASEAKAILALHPETRRFDASGLAEWFSVGCVLQDRTLFKGITLLPPGSAWTFHRDGRVDRNQYFEPSEWESQEPLSEGDYGKHLQEVFARVAPRYLRGTAKVAMSLTGGLDSRMLLAWAGARSGDLPCYTFGGPYRECADVKIARKLAALSGQSHETIPIDESLFQNFNDLAAQTVYLSDGTMDVSGAVELHMNQKARKIAPVRLTGNYGSEIVRCKVAFRPRLLNAADFTPEFSSLAEGAAQTYRHESDRAGSRQSFIAFKQVPWHHYSRLSIEQSQLTVRSPFLDNELVALAYRVPESLRGSAAPALGLIEAGIPSLATIATDRALGGKGSPALGRLERAWQRFTTRAEYAYDYGMPTRLARIDHQLAPLHLERLFLGRHKFYHFRIWYKEQLKEHLQQMAGSLEEPECYRSGSGQRMIRSHLSGRDNRTLDLHKLLSLHFIQSHLLRA